jgi:hypothetical protein
MTHVLVARVFLISCELTKYSSKYYGLSNYNSECISYYMHHLLSKANLMHVFGSWTERLENKWSVHFDVYQSITVSYTCLALSWCHCVAHYLLCGSFPVNSQFILDLDISYHSDMLPDRGTVCLPYIYRSICIITITTFQN